jgi:class 3 adenylate cyclase
VRAPPGSRGDSILATFDGPGRAIRCAALRDELGRIADHIAARVTAAARPGDILTSRTVRDLVVGSDITLVDRGAHRLKGVEGSWQLFVAPQP